MIEKKEKVEDNKDEICQIVYISRGNENFYSIYILMEFHTIGVRVEDMKLIISSASMTSLLIF